MDENHSLPPEIIISTYFVWETNDYGNAFFEWRNSVEKFNLNIHLKRENSISSSDGKAFDGHTR